VNGIVGFSYVPAGPSGGLSFLGMIFDAQHPIRSLKIFSGERGLGQSPSADISAGGQYDFVAMDDFIYSEPQPYIQAPEASETAVVMGLVALGAVLYRRHSRPNQGKGAALASRS